ncbi:NEDD8-activating enzyme E1 regulatory subunit, partial [Frankliniella fusca]
PLSLLACARRHAVPCAPESDLPPVARVAFNLYIGGGRPWFRLGLFSRSPLLWILITLSERAFYFSLHPTRRKEQDPVPPCFSAVDTF